jgi:hypothetical protein
MLEVTRKSILSGKMHSMELDISQEQLDFSSVFLQQSVAIYTAAKNSQLGKNQTKETIQ